MEDFVYMVTVDDALAWELYKTSLSWALIDAALEHAPKEIRNGEGDITVEIKDDHFVITLHAEGEV